MTLVERLRLAYRPADPIPMPICDEAADRIESLEKALREIAVPASTWPSDYDACDMYEAVVAIARAALKEGEDDAG